MNTVSQNLFNQSFDDKNTQKEYSERFIPSFTEQSTSQETTPKPGRFLTALFQLFNGLMTNK